MSLEFNSVLTRESSQIKLGVVSLCISLTPRLNCPYFSLGEAEGFQEHRCLDQVFTLRLLMVSMKLYAAGSISQAVVCYFYRLQAVWECEASPGCQAAKSDKLSSPVSSRTVHDKGQNGSRTMPLDSTDANPNPGSVSLHLECWYLFALVLRMSVRPLPAVKAKTLIRYFVSRVVSLRSAILPNTFTFARLFYLPLNKIM